MVSRISLVHACIRHTYAEAGSDSPDYHVRQRKGCRLKQASNHKQRATEQHRPSPAQRIAREDCEDGSEDTSQRVGRHDLALDL